MMNSRLLRPIVLTLYVAALALVSACRRESAAPPPPQPARATNATTTVAVPQDMANTQVAEVIVPSQSEFVSDSRIGTAAGPAGMVADQLETFKRGQPVRLSMWLKESPTGLQMSAVVFDENDQKVAEDRKPMNGAKTVTFTFDSKKLKPGNYRVVGYWGGNVAAEYVVTITK